MPRDAFSLTANVQRNGGHKWVKGPRRPSVTPWAAFFHVRHITTNTQIMLIQYCLTYLLVRENWEWELKNDIWRLEFLGPQLWSPFEPFGTTRLWCCEGFRGALDCFLMMPRHEVSRKAIHLISVVFPSLGKKGVIARTVFSLVFLILLLNFLQSLIILIINCFSCYLYC